MRRTFSMFRAVAVLGFLVLSGCVDGAGPRPRPGGLDPDGEPGNGGSALLQWYELQPRVVVRGSTDSVTLTASIAGTPQSAIVVLRSGAQVPLQHVDGLYRARLPVSQMMFGYREGDLHQAGAVVQVTASDSTASHAVVINVNDETVPAASRIAISPTMQRSEHVVNIRHDVLSPGSPIAAPVVQAFYNRFPDEFQFVAVVEAVWSNKRPFYTAVRNDVSGIGLQPFDQGLLYGSQSELEGIVQFPKDSDIDLGRTDNIHEIAHRWMNHLQHPLLVQARKHWPLSTLTIGITGWSDPLTGLPVIVPYSFSERSDGTYAVTAAPQPRTFNDLELYLMGLLPADSVQPHIVFANENQRSELRSGGVLQGPVDTVRIAQIIATSGTRNPSSGVAPREFSLATIVLTRGRLLTQQELDFFEHVAARGEARVALDFSNGLTRGETLPFYLATGGRATLTTSVREVEIL